jgi:hypothetical protein
MKILIKFIYAIIIIGAIIIFISAFRAYFIFSYNPDTGITCDGFGRMVTKAPVLVELITREKEWVGYKWFAFDLVVFWVSIYIEYLLIKLTGYLEDKYINKKDSKISYDNYEE